MIISHSNGSSSGFQIISSTGRVSLHAGGGVLVRGAIPPGVVEIRDVAIVACRAMSTGQEQNEGWVSAGHAIFISFDLAAIIIIIITTTIIII